MSQGAIRFARGVRAVSNVDKSSRAHGLAAVTGAVLLAASLSGCAGFLPQPPSFNTTWLLPTATSPGGTPTDAPPSASPQTVEPHIGPGPSRTGLRSDHGLRDQPEPMACTAFDYEDTSRYAGLSVADLAVLRARRNDCVYALKQMIDAAWQPYRGTLLSRVGETDAGLDAAATIASAAAAATTKVASKVLSVLASTATGAKGAIDNDVLLKSAIKDILSQMDTDRSKVWSSILISEQSEIGVYPMNHALSDLLSYFNAGTLADGIEKLDSNTALTAKTCQNATQTVIAATDAIRPDGGKVRSLAAAQASAAGGVVSTDSEQCQQLRTEASKALNATLDTPAVAADKGKIAAAIMAFGLADEPRLKALDAALGTEPKLAPDASAQQIWSAERRAALDFFEQLPADQLQPTIDRVKSLTAEEL